MEPSVSSPSEAKLKTPRTNHKVYLPQTNEQFSACPKPILPLWAILPSINKVGCNTLWNCINNWIWVLMARKQEVYLRLREHTHSEEKQVRKECGDRVKSIAETPRRLQWSCVRSNARWWPREQAVRKVVRWIRERKGPIQLKWQVQLRRPCWQRSQELLQEPCNPRLWIHVPILSLLFLHLKPFLHTTPKCRSDLFTPILQSLYGSTVFSVMKSRVLSMIQNTDVKKQLQLCYAKFFTSLQRNNFRS